MAPASKLPQRMAYREQPHTPGGPLLPVEVVREGPPRSAKVRIRWLSGDYEGLEDWVTRARLIVSWDEREAFLQNEHRVAEADKASGSVAFTLAWEAVELVFEALQRSYPNMPILGPSAATRQLLSMRNLEETAALLGLDSQALLDEPHAWLDRSGTYLAPFPVALRIARHCCERFTSQILGYVRAQEVALQDALVTELYVAPNTSTPIQYHMTRSEAEAELMKEAPRFEMIRGWCAADAVAEFNEVLALREEVARLRALVESTAVWLREAGHPQKAASLRRALGEAEHSEMTKREQTL